MIITFDSKYPNLNFVFGICFCSNATDILVVVCTFCYHRTIITEHTQPNELRSTCNQLIDQAKRKNTFTLIAVEESFIHSFIQNDTSFYQYE